MENKTKNVFSHLMQNNEETTKIQKVITFKIPFDDYKSFRLSTMSSGYKSMSEYLREACYKLINNQEESISKLKEIIPNE